jgi:xanthine dehydrogenase accessory factor
VARQDLAERSAQLRAARVPFVHARVILAEAPTSARPGDEAIVTVDGDLIGFVGGTCAEATVREQALGLLANAGSANTLVLRVTPVVEEGPAGQTGKRVVHNPCLSGGTIEIFLQAEIPPLVVAVAGRAPIAGALRDLGEHAGFDVRSYEAPGEFPADTGAIVVAAHGAGAEADLLVAALDAGVPYVGLVASRRRGRGVVDSLPLPDELKRQIHTPAGLDIGARRPEEVALSILAEIVALRPRARPPDETSRPLASAPATGEWAVDPVCGMSVRTGPDALRVSYHGAAIWFCGPGCRDAFAADPASYGGD